MTRDSSQPLTGSGTRADWRRDQRRGPAVRWIAIKPTLPLLALTTGQAALMPVAPLPVHKGKVAHRIEWWSTLSASRSGGRSGRTDRSSPPHRRRRMMAVISKSLPHQREPSALTSHGTVFRAFHEDAFVIWPSWSRIRAWLSSNGGCFGIGGPRGMGKSWHMLMAIRYAETKGGVGVWFPTPSEYDPMAFLSALTDQLAGALEERLRPRHLLPRLRLHVPALTIGSLALIGASLLSFLIASPLYFALSSKWSILAIALAAPGVLGIYLPLHFYYSAHRTGRRGLERLSFSVRRKRSESESGSVPLCGQPQRSAERPAEESLVASRRHESAS